MDSEYFTSAKRIVQRLENEGIFIEDKQLFLVRTADSLKACHEEIKLIASSSGITEEDALDLISLRTAQVKPQPCLIQAAMGNNLPKFNNIPGRGHGFNGLCSLPAKTDCLTAGIPIIPVAHDPRVLPKAYASDEFVPQVTATDTSTYSDPVQFA